MLKELHRICEANDITYYLSYGTLLGAIRDKEAIPWDYDVDVQVPYNEKDKLINALKVNLNSEYYIHCPEVDSKCRHFFLRLSKVGYNSSALHVDVFYLIGTPFDNPKYKKFARKIYFVAMARYYKLVNAREESLGRKTTYIIMMIYKGLYKPIPLGLLNYLYHRFCTKYDYDNCEYYMTADTFGHLYRYPKNLYQNREIVKFNDGDYYVPAGYMEILEQLYGDYKNYPSIESRYNEFMQSLTRLEYFDKIFKI